MSLIGVDWGTTNRRIHRIERGRAVATVRDDQGVKAMAAGGYADALDAIRAAHGDGPVLMAGMVGSTIGWRTVPYVDVPATLKTLAAALEPVAPDAWIVPGVARRGDRPDVMRGEEVQLLGAVAAGLAPPDALVCQPGTHAKWATMAGGAIVDFVTAMTGELFALLRTHSVLGAALAGPVADDDAFAAGVEQGARGDLVAALFGVRAASVLGTRPGAEAASHASGLLIGADVAARGVAGRTVHLIADAPLDRLYARAIALLGGRAVAIDADTAFVSGISAIMEHRR